jgi:hypothetical protein
MGGESRQPTRGGPPCWGLGEVLTAPHCKKLQRYETFHKASELRRRWEDNIKMDLQEVGWGTWTGMIWFRIGTGGGPL